MILSTASVISLEQLIGLAAMAALAGGGVAGGLFKGLLAAFKSSRESLEALTADRDADRKRAGEAEERQKNEFIEYQRLADDRERACLGNVSRLQGQVDILSSDILAKLVDAASQASAAAVRVAIIDERENLRINTIGVLAAAERNLREGPQ